MIVYATKTDLIGWLGETPDHDDTYLTRLLRHASMLVGRACRSDLYDADPNGLPEDPDLLEAMVEATCAQTETWLAAGVDPTDGGISNAVTAVATTEIDDARVTYDPSDVISAAKAARRTTTSLCLTAYEILRSAGLATAHV